MANRHLAQWYTLVRFHATPTNLTAVAQTRTAVEAQQLTAAWLDRFPAETACVFDPENVPLDSAALARAAQLESPLAMPLSAEGYADNYTRQTFTAGARAEHRSA